jgi:hypothetical protein
MVENVSDGDEELEADLEKAWEVLNPDINRLIASISNRLNMKPDRVKELAIIMLYHQLELKKNGQVFIVAPAASTFLYKDPLEALAAQDTTGLFSKVVDQVQGDSGGS